MQDYNYEWNNLLRSLMDNDSIGSHLGQIQFQLDILHNIYHSIVACLLDIFNIFLNFTCNVYCFDKVRTYFCQDSNIKVLDKWSNICLKLRSKQKDIDSFGIPHLLNMELKLDMNIFQDDNHMIIRMDSFDKS
jgi:hypothetical protein